MDMTTDYMQPLLKLDFEKHERRVRELVYHDALGLP
jgi:hypothetical protein